MPDRPLDADELIATLGLTAHPEGGWYAETWRDEASSAIWFLLRTGESSHWHRVIGATEIWHHYVGDPVLLRVSPDGAAVTTATLGPAIDAGQRPQAVVPPGEWQAASLAPGDHGFALVGCTVAPPFRFESFELAAPRWAPSG